MPELPDLQVFSHNLEKMLKGKKLKKITVSGKRIKISAAQLNKRLSGSRIKKIFRQGKQLRFYFDNDETLGLHLMLHGKLIFYKKKNAEKYTVADLQFDDNTGIVITDFQEMANIFLDPPTNDAPDALSKNLTPAYLKRTFSESKKQVKELLLDQNIIQGIGNAYADEILWTAGISPFSIANKIPPGKLTSLSQSIKKVLKAAEKKILKSNPDIIAGEIRDFMLIHNSKKQQSPGGKKINHTEGSRKTYYTSEQVMYK